MKYFTPRAWLNVGLSVLCIVLQLVFGAPYYVFAAAAVGCLLNVAAEWRHARPRVVDSWQRNGFYLRIVSQAGATRSEVWAADQWTPIPAHLGPGYLGANRWAEAAFQNQCAPHALHRRN